VRPSRPALLAPVSLHAQDTGSGVATIGTPATAGTPATPASPAAGMAAETGAAVPAGPVGAPIGGGSLGDPVGGAAVAAPVRLGPFGATFSGAEPEAATRAWTVTPSIGLFGGATNNVYQARHDPRADVFLEIVPGIVVDGATARVRATLSYTPNVRLYAHYSDQNTVSQIGSGQVLAELVPGALFLDIRGSASVGTATGGFAPGTAQNAQRDNQVQYYNFSASPYYVHRFGSLATAQIGYVFQYSSQTGTNTFAPGTAQPFFNDDDYIANRGYVVVRSGEDLGRLALQARVDGTAFIGDGVYDDAHVFVAALEGRYAILPTIAVLLEGGYESIEYGGTAPQRINDAIWSVGVRLTPTPESYLVARYGHRGGFDSPSLEAGIQLGAYTRLTASYIERLGTSATIGQDLLATTTLDRLGNPIDAQTGAPVLYANPFFPSTSGLYRIKNGSVALTFSWPRDSVSLFAYYQEQTPVSAMPGTIIAKSTGYYGGISWTHAVSTETAVTASVQYGRSEYGNDPSLDALYLTAGISHQLGRGLTGIAQIYYASQTTKQPDTGYGQATIMIGVSQSF
jgi:uncharacterized protein (PEP-CTERM system associated)